MGFNCGIVGLPNVGKSTLFNALTSTKSAQAENFPFCTIDPNIGRVYVPDKRLSKISDIAMSDQIIPTQLEFVDIAGLVEGASNGEGLGNKFLAKIREVDAIIHVLRCFEDDNISHINSNIDPIRDSEIVETELLLADLEMVEKQIKVISKKANSGDIDAKEEIELLELIFDTLKDGRMANSIRPQDEISLKKFKQLQLLTDKPVLFVSNVEENVISHGNQFSKCVDKKADSTNCKNIIISASIEAELSEFENDKERVDFLKTYGLSNDGLTKIINEGYGLLNLITFFTAGPKETRAWTITRGTKAPEAGGKIHSDFEKGFIRAETIRYEDYLTLGGEKAAREAGKMSQEGKEYTVKDGDIIHFLFNV